MDILDTDGETISQKVVSCKKIFLNAGSLGSTQLFLASQAKGKLNNLDESIGNFWGNNGNIMAGRNMVNTLFNRVEKGPEEGDFAPVTGTKQSTIPVARIDNWNGKENSFFAEISPLPMGMEVYTALYLVVPNKHIFN